MIMDVATKQKVAAFEISAWNNHEAGRIDPIWLNNNTVIGKDDDRTQSFIRVFSKPPEKKAEKKKKKGEDVTELPEVENGKSINELIKEINAVVKEWREIYTPIKDGKNDTLKAAGMDKKKSAGAKEVMLGLAVAAVADAKMS